MPARQDPISAKVAACPGAALPSGRQACKIGRIEWGHGARKGFALEGIAEGRFAGCDTTLVSQVRSQAYSGMVAGMLAGQYQLRQLSFDLEAIARAAGVTYVGAAATAIRAAAAEVELADGTRLDYDVLSVATGSTVQGAELPGVADRSLQLKPIDRALEIIPALERGRQSRSRPSGGRGRRGVPQASRSRSPPGRSFGS